MCAQRLELEEQLRIAKFVGRVFAWIAEQLRDAGLASSLWNSCS
jgi:hypothetical protein